MHFLNCENIYSRRNTLLNTVFAYWIYGKCRRTWAVLELPGPVCPIDRSVDLLWSVSIFKTVCKNIFWVQTWTIWLKNVILYRTIWSKWSALSVYLSLLWSEKGKLLKSTTQKSLATTCPILSWPFVTSGICQLV